MYLLLLLDSDVAVDLGLQSFSIGFDVYMSWLILLKRMVEGR
jgi:hypothetical protein